MACEFVAYCRVATDRQGRSGLGLETQRAVDAFIAAANGGSKLRASYEQIESGKRDDPPALAKAMEHARLTEATLLIAKLDRLSRDAHFLLGPQKSGARFVACDMPDANNLTVGILALVAQNERPAISRRTKEALARARKRITKTGQKAHPEIKRLGNPRARLTSASTAMPRLVFEGRSCRSTMNGSRDALNKCRVRRRLSAPLIVSR